MAEFFNAVPYDAVAPGNHEFDLGTGVFRGLVAEIKVPVLAANVYDSGNGKRVSFLSPSIIKNVAGVKVGIFGLLTSRMPALAVRGNIAGLEFRREVDEARKVVRSLRRRGATVIIAVTHIGFENPDRFPFEGDQTLAAMVPGIDLIVGGHSHTELARPLKDATHGTLIAHAGAKLRRVGRVVLDIDPVSGRVVGSRGGLVDLEGVNTAPDPRVQEIVRRYQRAVAEEADVVLASAERRLEGYGDPESPVGNWLTDCVRSRTGADIALQNSGGIRASLPAGTVTFRALFNIMPFENRVVLLRMRGRVVRAVFEASGGAGALQVSGMRVGYRRGRRRRGRRIADIEVGGAPLREDRLYTVAVSDYMVERESSVPFESAESREAGGGLIRDMMVGCAREQGRVMPPVPGRIYIH